MPIAYQDRGTIRRMHDPVRRIRIRLLVFTAAMIAATIIVAALVGRR